MPKRSCKISAEKFCYVCGEYIVSRKGKVITDSMKNAYLHYFGFSVSGTEKSWVPKLFCNACRTKLYRWSIGDKIYLPFSSPMLWREPQNHTDDCYFCSTKVVGINSKNVKGLKYPEVSSVTRPIPRRKGDRLPICPGTSSCTVETSDVNMSSDGSDSEFVAEEKHLISQAELSDLIRDLQLSKQKAELLASRMQQWGYLDKAAKVTIYRSRNEELTPYFTKRNEMCYCNDVVGLFEAMKQPYDKNEWRLFIDGSKYSLKAALLHDGNKKPSIPLAHAHNTKENYMTMIDILRNIRYDEHNWRICGDLKVIGLLTGMQSGFTKYCCFLCLWDSRATEHHYKKKDWPVRHQYTPGQQSVSATPLVDPTRVLLPPLHIKLGLMKNFVKALNRDGQGFQYLIKLFPKISYAKIKEGIFVGPDIRRLMNDDNFSKCLSAKEAAAWRSFKSVVRNFLGNTKSNDYKRIVANLLKNYREMGVRMSLKIHFIHSHLNFFPDNLGATSDEQGERLHQDLQRIEKNYKGFWDEGMLSDYCWSLIRETDPKKYKRRSSTALHF